MVKGRGIWERWGDGKGVKRGKSGTHVVGDVDARVDNVRAGALAGTVVVHVAGGARGAVRDARQAPGDVLLGHVVVGRDDGVLLDVLDLPQTSVPLRA
jgi:hypothetical protein